MALPTDQNHSISFLNGNGEMAMLTRQFDWRSTSLSEPAAWPQSLKTTISIILNSKFPMFLFWGPDHICFYNDAYRPSLGMNGKHPALGKPGATIWPEIWANIKPLIDQVLNGGEASWNEDLLLPIYRNGKMEDVYWTFSYSPVTDETGQPAGVFVTCSETTDKVKLIDRLLISDNRFQNLVREVTIGVIVLDGPEMIISLVNEGYSRLIGRRADELTGKPLFSIIPEAEAIFRPVIEKVRVTGESTYLNEQIYTVNIGSEKISGFLNLVYQPYTETDGTITGVMVLCQDVTEQVNSKLKAEESEERARLAVEASGLGTYDLNLQTDRIVTSPRLDEIMGVSHDTEHAVYFAGLHPDDKAIRNTAFEEAVSTGTLKYQARINKGNEIRWIQVAGRLYKDPEGRPLRLLGTMLDITEQVNAREAVNKANEGLGAANEELAATNEELTDTQQYLQQLNSQLTTSELRFRSLIEKAPVAIAIFNGREQLIEAANYRMLKMLGKSTEIIGKRFADAVPELNGQPYFALLDDIFTTGEIYHGLESKATIAHNGQLKEGYFNFIFQPLKNAEDAVEAVMAISIEVTEQVNARKELEQAYEQARLSKEAAQLGTFDMDMLQNTMQWDTRCRHLFGIKHQGPVTYEKDFVTGLHPDDRERIIAVISDVFIKSKTNGVYDVEYRTVGAEDQKLRWVKAKGQVYFDDKEQPLRFIGSVLDITEQKEDELRKNDFIGMVSHELKTPLTSLTAIIQVLNMKLKSSGDQFVSDSLNRANIQVKKMSSMINGFLNLSRLESGKMQVDKTDFNMEELVANTIEDTQLVALGHHINLKPCSSFRVHADKDKISSVVTNLLSNAVKYSPKGRDIDVACSKKEESVRVSVRDYGIGIAQDDIASLFDRYYRVNNPNYKHISGFGIGLYLSAEIIRSHDGHIGVDSKPGAGSTFYFDLPLK